jgi:predicted DNA-binding ribbon-helix-helix protein
MSTYYRTQILLEPGQHQALTELARRQGRSLSDLIREIAAEHLDAQDRQARRQRELQALQTLAEIRSRVQAEHGMCAGDLLAKVRDEREQDLERAWQEGQ